MFISLARIDDRLIHGQIVQGWLKSICVDVVLVASDCAVKDFIQQTLMFLAMPCGTRLDVKSVKDSITALLNGSYNGERLIVLTANPKDLFLMIEKGVELKSINAGGMHFTDGKRQLLYNLFADNEDVEYLHKIYLKDIEIEGRVLPMDERTSIVSIIEREYQIIHRG